MSALHVRDHLTAVVAPVLAAFAVAIRYQFANGVTVGLLVALALAPVWVSYLPRYRGMILMLSLGPVAVASAALISTFDTLRHTSSRLMLQETLELLWMFGIIGTLLWVRSCVGTNVMALAYGVGAAASVFLGGGNPTNLWKYSLSVPVTIVILALTRERRNSRALEMLALALLGVGSLVSDSRSFAALLILTAVTVIWQMRPRSGALRLRSWTTLAALAIFTLGAYELLQALILDGLLGDAAQTRSQAQLDASGSLIAGGRPELGAALALIAAQWWGYGSGTLPTSTDVSVAKTGMSDLNYDPNNGYVEVYMFGGHFEVHSVLGDLWIRFGLAGAVLAVAMALHGLLAVARKASLRAASALEVFVVLLMLWNTLFSPFTSSFRLAAVAVALLASPTARPDPHSASSATTGLRTDGNHTPASNLP